MKSVILIILTLILTSSLASQQGSWGGRNRSEPVIESAVSIRRIYTTVGGRLEPGLRTIHDAPITGLVEEIFVEEGSRVNAGDPLFSVIQDDPGNRFLPLVVEARHSGVVSEIMIGEFDDVMDGQPSVAVVDIENLILEAVVSDLDAFTIQPGINVTGYDTRGLEYSGTLESISSEPDYQTGLFTLSFRFNSGTGSRLGMPLFIDIPVREVSGFFVPSDSVVRRYGRNSVWTVDDSGLLESTEVVTGPVIDNFILITSGLEAGVSYLSSPTGREQEGANVQDLLAGSSREGR